LEDDREIAGEIFIRFAIDLQIDRRFDSIVLRSAREIGEILYIFCKLLVLKRRLLL
jgi:hypothetical protein